MKLKFNLKINWNFIWQYDIWSETLFLKNMVQYGFYEAVSMAQSHPEYFPEFKIKKIL